MLDSSSHLRVVKDVLVFCHTKSKILTQEMNHTEIHQKHIILSKFWLGILTQFVLRSKNLITIPQCLKYKYEIACRILTPALLASVSFMDCFRDAKSIFGPQSLLASVSSDCTCSVCQFELALIRLKAAERVHSTLSLSHFYCVLNAAVFGFSVWCRNRKSPAAVGNFARRKAGNSHVLIKTQRGASLASN